MSPALNYADKFMLGGVQPSAVYLGSTKVWPGFKPTDLSGCAVWMDATKLALANGAAVSSWTNLGSGSQPTITAGATFRTNALNSRPVVRITQGSGKFRWYSGTGVDKDYTICYVGRRWQLRGGRVITAFNTASNLLIGFHGNEMEQCYIEGWLTGQIPLASTQWKLYSADSTSAAVARFFSNGVLNSQGAATPAKGWGGTLCISGYIDDPNLATSQEADCEIAELVMYNRKLTDAERVQVETYLRAKWNPITTFVPTDYGANIVAWFDGADPGTITITGAGVSNWANKGVGGMTLTQTVDAQRPSYGNFNGVIINQGQILNPAGAPATFDFILVARPLYVPDWRTMLRSGSGHEMMIESTSTRFGCYTTNGFNPAGTYTWSIGDGIGFARVAASAVTMMSRDGGALASTTTALPAASAATTMFGAYASAPPSQAFGSVREAFYLPYNSEGARPVMEGYLAWKWGLQSLLPAGHMYKAAPP